MRPGDQEVRADFAQMFNAYVELARADQEGLGEDAWQLNTEKTLPLQFVAQVDVWEKVTEHLLKRTFAPRKERPN
eukprot:5191727-Lingulodinium_polyedra.AAC.1